MSIINAIRSKNIFNRQLKNEADNSVVLMVAGNKKSIPVIGYLIRPGKKCNSLISQETGGKLTQEKCAMVTEIHLMRALAFRLIATQMERLTKPTRIHLFVNEWIFNVLTLANPREECKTIAPMSDIPDVYYNHVKYQMIRHNVTTHLIPSNHPWSDELNEQLDTAVSNHIQRMPKLDELDDVVNAISLEVRLQDAEDSEKYYRQELANAMDTIHDLRALVEDRENLE